MAQYAVAFDIDTKHLRDDGVSNAERTKIYQQELLDALASCGFTVHLQGSLYATAADQDPLKAIMQLQSTLAGKAPRFCKYVKRLHVFRLEEWSDVTPLVAGHAAAPLPDADEEYEEEARLARARA